MGLQTEAHKQRQNGLFIDFFFFLLTLDKLFPVFVMLIFVAELLGQHMLVLKMCWQLFFFI